MISASKAQTAAIKRAEAEGGGDLDSSLRDELRDAARGDDGLGRLLDELGRKDAWWTRDEP
jgi:hypothetical protein